MLLAGVSSYQVSASANALFSEAKTLWGRGRVRTGRARRSCHVRFEFRYRGELRRGLSKSCGLKSDVATSCRISVSAGVEISKKKAAQKQTQGKSRDLELEKEFKMGTRSRKRGSADVIFEGRSNKEFGKDFAVLAELLSQQDRKSASVLEGQKLPFPKNNPGRVPNQTVGSVRTMKDILDSLPSKAEDKNRADSDSNETLFKRYSSEKSYSQLQNRQVGGMKILVEGGKTMKVPEEQSIDSPVTKGRLKGNIFTKSVRSRNATIEGGSENAITQASPSMSIQSSAEAILASRQLPAEASPKVEEDAVVDRVEKPSLRGHEILFAMQKAAMEKAKRKERNRTASVRAGKVKERNRTASVRAGKVKENDLPQKTLDWRDARPIVIRPEWALQIESLEGRIKDMKNRMQT